MSKHNLTSEHGDEIRRKYQNESIGQRELAKEYGCTQSFISQVVNGKALTGKFEPLGPKVQQQDWKIKILGRELTILKGEHTKLLDSHEELQERVKVLELQVAEQHVKISRLEKECDQYKERYRRALDDKHKAMEKQ